MAPDATCSSSRSNLVRGAELRRRRLPVRRPARGNGFGFVSFRYRAATELSKTMKSSVFGSAASEHHLAVRTWIRRGEPGAAARRPHGDEPLGDLASQVELSQRMRSQLTQRRLCILGARLVGHDADANLALDAPRQHGH